MGKKYPQKGNAPYKRYEPKPFPRNLTIIQVDPIFDLSWLNFSQNEDGVTPDDKLFERGRKKSATVNTADLYVHFSTSTGFGKKVPFLTSSDFYNLYNYAHGCANVSDLALLIEYGVRSIGVKETRLDAKLDYLRRLDDLTGGRFLKHSSSSKPWLLLLNRGDGLPFGVRQSTIKNVVFTAYDDKLKSLASSLGKDGCSFEFVSRNSWPKRSFLHMGHALGINFWLLTAGLPEVNFDSLASFFDADINLFGYVNIDKERSSGARVLREKLRSVEVLFCGRDE